MTTPLSAAGIVLCGGRSRRMGTSKAWLPFGPERMLQRVVRLLGAVARPIAVVAAPGQDLPSLPVEVAVVRDRREGLGPLEGIAAGLSALGEEHERAFLTSCDVPLLRPAFAQRMFDLLGDCDIAVPHVGDYHHPLAAVYRRRVLADVESLLAADRLRPVFLFERVRTRIVRPEELVDVDPRFESLRNLNHPEDYRAALATAGFEVPPEGADA